MLLFIFDYIMFEVILLILFSQISLLQVRNDTEMNPVTLMKVRIKYWTSA